MKNKYERETNVIFRCCIYKVEDFTMINGKYTYTLGSGDVVTFPINEEDISPYIEGWHKKYKITYRGEGKNE